MKPPVTASRVGGHIELELRRDPSQFDELARRFRQEPEAVAELLTALADALYARDDAAGGSRDGELTDAYEQADAAVDDARDALAGEVEENEGLEPARARLTPQQALALGEQLGQGAVPWGSRQAPRSVTPQRNGGAAA